MSVLAGVKHIVLAVSLFTAASLAVGQPVAAKTTNSEPLPSIGHPKSEPEAIYPSLFVINADGATLQGDVLTLSGVAASSIVFADRPVRAAGHVPTDQIVGEWSPGQDSFDSTPPNATVSVFLGDGEQVKDAVVVLKEPKLQGRDLTFQVDVLEGDLDGAEGAAAVFIDIIGMPWTPVSYAGVARRMTRRAIWYGAATHPGYHPCY